MVAQTTDIATDLVTPFGAYLRLRRTARAAFLLESVERGRLGRYSFVGAGDGPCLIFMTGARIGWPDKGLVYPRSELARRHGAGVETETTSDRRRSTQTLQSA